MTDINTFIAQFISNLEHLKKLVESFENANDSKRVKISISDIDRCIQHGAYYLEDPSLYQPSTFSFDSGIISLVDTIRYNDFGITLSIAEENEKLRLCDQLTELVEKTIEVNNKMERK
jgi:hypothetical protein